MKWVGLIITPPQYETGIPHETLDLCVCAQSFVSILALFSRPPQRDGAQQKGGDVCWQAARGAVPSGGRQVSSHWSTAHCSPLIGRQARTCRHLVEGGPADPRQHLHQCKIH